MHWRLALDLGTNSIGWSALRLDKDGSISRFLDMGVRIFSDSRDTKSGMPLNEERRICRQMRRQRERKIRRKQAMKAFCIQHGLLPVDKETRQLISSWNPYKLRKDALERPLDPYELGRIFMQFAGHRGFRSIRKEQNKTKSAEVSGMKAGIEKLSTVLNAKTLGQWLYDQQQKGEPVRFRPTLEGTQIIYPFYPSRDMYEQEFERIRQNQMASFPKLNWERVHWLIFFQRPLKQPERGKCQFYTDEERGYKALPSAHRFRILQEINNLAFYDADNGLTEIPVKMKKRLYTLLEQNKSIRFDTMRSLLGNSTIGTFNLENGKRDRLSGNETSVEFRKKTLWGPLWDNLSWEDQDAIIESLITENDESALQSLLQKYNVPPENIQNILGYNFPTGTTMLSARFMRDCAKVMIEQQLPYHEATQKLGFHHSKEEQPILRYSLPYYGQVLTALVQGAHGTPPDNLLFPNNQAKCEYIYGKIANPTVHVALNQVRKLVNTLIRRFGRPEEIILEVGRELKLSKAKKMEIFKEQTENQKKNERAESELKQLGLIAPSKEDIKKYLLWEELAPTGIARCCPYCGKPIAGNQLFGNEIEIEHILPYSKTLLNTRDNLTVAHRHCNQIKGERTPYEAFSSNPKGYNWEQIVERAQRLPYKKRIKFSPEALKNFQDLFLQRQLTDNAYISRSAKQYLAVICNMNRIWVSTGRLTSMLRGEWGLNTILNRSHDTWYKNRSDHRHHALDALVIGLCDRGLINKMARLNSGRGYARLAIPEFPIERESIHNKIETMAVSLKLDHGRDGKIFRETAMGKIRRIRKISPSELEEKEIKTIIPPKIKEHVQAICTNKKFKDVKEQIVKQFTHFYIVQEYWVSTTPITELSESDIKEGRIVDPIIRKKLQDFYKEHNGDKDELKKILQKFSEMTQIKAVRYTPKDQIPIPIPSAPYKAYMPLDYYRVDIWEIPQRKKSRKDKPSEYHGVFISRAMAYLDEKPDKPHPAARFIMSLYKGDIVQLEARDPNISFREFACIAGYSATQNKVDIQPLSAAGSIAEWAKNTNKQFVSRFWPEECKGQNFKSINSLFSEFIVKPVKITVDGRIFSR
jgi:CRISPR-associated endonuclease Csn1